MNNKKFLFLYIIFFSLLIFYANKSLAQKINLGTNVNTKFAELTPVISTDGKTLFFARRGHLNNKGYGKRDFDDDIWISTQDAFGNWSTALNVGYPLNNDCFSSVCSVSPDGNSLLIQGLFDKSDCVKNPDELYLYSSDKTKTGWTIPKKINVKKFYNKNIYADFYLSSDGKVLFMAIEGKTSTGDLDIYVSLLDSNNFFSEPFNIGSTVNTSSKEYSPFLASDGVSLYFSSKGHLGLGDADVFVTRRLDDSWRHWSVPENLGSTINTKGADAYYVIPASGNFAYFVSTDSSYGAEDIYKILLPQNVKPKPVVLFKGKVFNSKTNEPLEAKIDIESLPYGDALGSVKTDPVSGEYIFTLPIGYKYGIKAGLKGYLYITDTVDAQKFVDYTEIEKNIYLTPAEEGVTVRLNNIYFDVSKAELKTESYPELNKVILFLNNNPNIAIEISGHTDNSGTDLINNKLSEDRAKSVANYIVSKNIAKDRITSKGYGSSKPVASNTTDDGKKLNRRVEFTIISSNYVPGKTDIVKLDTSYVKSDSTYAKKDSVKTEKKKITGTICKTYFDVNQVELDKSNYTELSKAITILKENPDLNVLICGHSDKTGGKEDDNLTASEKRANAVKAYLVSKGISKSRLKTKGYGSKKPASKKDTEAGRKLNRRVEIIVQ